MLLVLEQQEPELLTGNVVIGRGGDGLGLVILEVLSNPVIP